MADVRLKNFSLQLHDDESDLYDREKNFNKLTASGKNEWILVRFYYIKDFHLHTKSLNAKNSQSTNFHVVCNCLFVMHCYKHQIIIL